MEFEENYLSHPNYPSLFSITDSLDLSRIDNVAASIDKAEYHNLPQHFIASVELEGNSKFCYVRKGKKVVLYDEGKKLKMAHKEFLQKWDGIVLVLEDSPSRGKIRFRTEQLLFLAPLFALPAITSPYTTLDLIFCLLSASGLFLATAILLGEYGTSPNYASKLCLTRKKNCNSISNSEASKINGWLSLSDLPLIFFLTNCLTYLFGYSFFGIIGLASLSSLPVVAYTVYIQFFKLKSWCSLCLLVSLLVFLQAVMLLLHYESVVITYQQGWKYILIGGTISLLWLALRQFYSRFQAKSIQVRELLKFKRNFATFSFLSTKVKNSTALDTLLPVKIDNADGPITLRLFLSPGCGYCHRVFKEAHQLSLDFSGKVSLSVYFNINIDNTGNTLAGIAEIMTQVNLTGTNPAEAVRDWYARGLFPEDWKKKWSLPITEDARNELRRQYDWSTENNLNHTPVVVVGDSIMPSEYTVTELGYFIAELQETAAKEQAV